MRIRRCVIPLFLAAIVLCVVLGFAEREVAAAGPTGVGQSSPQPSGPATVSIQPSAGTVVVGERFTVTIRIDGLATPLSAFQFDLGYDPALVAPLGAEPGPFLPSTGRAVICPQPTTPITGTLRYACASTGRAGGPTGSGALATLTFVALGAGTSDLALSALQLPDTSIPPCAGQRHVPRSTGRHRPGRGRSPECGPIA